jgi:SAM-dependent methyltransferase
MADRAVLARQAMARRVPPSLLPYARAARRRVERVVALRPVRWGSLRRRDPIGSDWGSKRGKPVDRYFIEDFLLSHRSAITGHVLEVKEDLYATRFGHNVSAVDIVDIDPNNRKVTVLADLGVPHALPVERFDCIIVTQTLQFVGDLDQAFRSLYSALTPSGSLLLTVPSISRLERTLADVERWRFLPLGLEAMLRGCCPEADISVKGRGNQTAAIAFLSGLATRDLRSDELEHDDPLCPLIVAAAVRRPEVARATH